MWTQLLHVWPPASAHTLSRSPPQPRLHLHRHITAAPGEARRYSGGHSDPAQPPGTPPSYAAVTRQLRGSCTWRHTGRYRQSGIHWKYDRSTVLGLRIQYATAEQHCTNEWVLRVCVMAHGLGIRASARLEPYQQTGFPRLIQQPNEPITTAASCGSDRSHIGCQSHITASNSDPDSYQPCTVP